MGCFLRRTSQNCFTIPACLSTAFAVCRDRIFWSTGKRRCGLGLYQISWGLLCPVAQSSIPARGESPSVLACSRPSEGQDITIFVLVPYMKPRRTVARDPVQLQELGDEGSQLLGQNIG